MPEVYSVSVLLSIRPLLASRGRSVASKLRGALFGVLAAGGVLLAVIFPPNILAATDTTFGYVTEAGSSALSQAQGEVDASTYTLSGAPSGSVLTGLRIYGDGSSGAQDSILAVWDEPTGDLVGYCTPVWSSGGGWKSCTAVTLVSDGVMEDGDYRLGTMAPSGGGNGRNFYKGGTGALRYYYPCSCSTPPDPYADSGSAGSTNLLIEATVTFTDVDPPPDPPDPDSVDCTEAIDIPTCNNVVALFDAVEAGVPLAGVDRDRLDLAWTGAWAIGGLLLALLIAPMWYAAWRFWRD